MEEIMKLVILFCLIFWNRVFASPLPHPARAHEADGQEHIVIIDRSHPAPPRVADVLHRLDLHETHPDVRHVFNNTAFHGFAASMKSHCLDRLANMSDISLFEPAVRVSTTFASSAARARQVDSTFTTRPSAPWGLQRISTASAVGGSAQNLDYTYSFANPALGAGADIYIIDTGIYTAHSVFGGRARMLWSYNGDPADHDGHGTHVSGTAGGAVLGVASGANIIGVKALGSDGGGSSSDVVAAIDQVVRAHDARKASSSSPPFLGSVMSLSLAASGPVASLSSAIAAAIAAGVHTCVAAGNDHVNACGSSPSSSGGANGGAITVGALSSSSSSSPQIAPFSNTGPCVDVYAPGEDVISAWIGGPNIIKALDGTSMATPHVSGIVAYAMANATLAASPELMKQWVRGVAWGAGGGDDGGGILVASNGVRASGSG